MKDPTRRSGKRQLEKRLSKRPSKISSSFGMTFKCSALFMIREKYLDLDFFDINFTDMRDHDISDPFELVQVVSVQPVEEGGV